jgi:metal-responsive CopG/Arc/MetJ family transcriptional regulator
VKSVQKRPAGKTARPAPRIRASITFPTDLYQSLEVLAAQQKVSLAWIIRDAAERYVAERTSKPIA